MKRNAETTGRGTFRECKENSFSHNEKKDHRRKDLALGKIERERQQRGRGATKGKIG